jgi:hypothetical protein
MPGNRRATSRLIGKPLQGVSRIIRLFSQDNRSDILLRGAERIDYRSTPSTYSGIEGMKLFPRIGAKLLRHISAWAAIGKASLVIQGLLPEWDGGPPPPNLNAKERKAYRGEMHTEYVHQLQ